MGITVLSLFDGMSCGQIALERAGIKVDNYYASEIKKYGIKVTQENYPNTIQLGDVTKVRYKNGTLHSENGEFKVGNIDLVIGGSPCQNFSTACIKEKRLGLEGEKSKLFYEYLRILKEVNPKYWLLENVASMDKESRKQLDNYMETEGFVINSEILAPQLRKRLYWTNIPQTELVKTEDKLLQNVLDWGGYTERKKSRCLLEGDSRPNVTPIKMFHRYYATGFTTLIFKDKQHYINCKDHYDTYFKGKSAKEIDTLIIGMDLSVYDGLRYLNQNELEKCQTVPSGYTKSISRNEAASLLGDGWTVDVIAHIFKGLKNT